MSDEIPELTKKDFSRAITRETRLRLISGEWRAGDLAALRKYLGLTQKQFASRIGNKTGDSPKAQHEHFFDCSQNTQDSFFTIWKKSHKAVS